MPVGYRYTDINMQIVFISSLIVLIIFVFVKTFYKGYYRNLFYSFLIVDKLSAIEYNENNSPNLYVHIIVLLSSIISVSIALYTIIFYSGLFSAVESGNQFYILLKIMGIISLFLIFKWIVLLAIGNIYEVKKATNSYWKFIYNLIKVLSLIIFPFYILIPFVGEEINKVLIISLLVSFILAWLYKVYIFFSNSVKIKFFNHYTFLYFCTFEILPLLFLFKMIR